MHRGGRSGKKGFMSMLATRALCTGGLLWPGAWREGGGPLPALKKTGKKELFNFVILHCLL